MENISDFWYYKVFSIWNVNILLQIIKENQPRVLTQGLFWKVFFTWRKVRESSLITVVMLVKLSWVWLSNLYWPKLTALRIRCQFGKHVILCFIIVYIAGLVSPQTYRVQSHSQPAFTYVSGGLHDTGGGVCSRVSRNSLFAWFPSRISKLCILAEKGVQY